MILTTGIKAYRTKLTRSVKDPSDIISLSTDIRQREYNWEYECDDQSLICKYISHTTWESFCRFGDRNQATELMKLIWIRTAGEPLDTQAMWLSNDCGKEISPSQFAQFIAEHERGCPDFAYHRTTNELKEIFKQGTGFNWSYKVHDILVSFFPDVSELIENSVNLGE